MIFLSNLFVKLGNGEGKEYFWKKKLREETILAVASETNWSNCEWIIDRANLSGRWHVFFFETISDQQVIELQMIPIVALEKTRRIFPIFIVQNVRRREIQGNLLKCHCASSKVCWSTKIFARKTFHWKISWKIFAFQTLKKRQWTS